MSLPRLLQALTDLGLEFRVRPGEGHDEVVVVVPRARGPSRLEDAPPVAGPTARSAAAAASGGEPEPLAEPRARVDVPASFEDLPLRVRGLASLLRTTPSRSSPELRIYTAYLQGVQDLARVENRRQELPTDRPLAWAPRKCCYVVLRSRDAARVEGAVLVHRYRDFQWLTQDERGFAPESVSRGFASQAEAESYCLAAGLDGLAAPWSDQPAFP